MVARTLQQLRRVGANVAGSILNNVDLDRAYGKEYAYAGYYYAEGAKGARRGKGKPPRQASAPAPAPVSDPGPPRLGPGIVLRTLRGLPPGRVLHRLARPLRGASRRVAHALGAGPGRVEPAAPGGPRATSQTRQDVDTAGVLLLRGDHTRPWREPRLDRRPDPALDLPPSRARRAQEDRSPDARLKLLDRWIGGEPVRVTPGWESYPASLRIVNASRRLSVVGDGALAARADALALAVLVAGGESRDRSGREPPLQERLALAWAGRCLRGRSPDALAIVWRRARGPGACGADSGRRLSRRAVARISRRPRRRSHPLRAPAPRDRRGPHAASVAVSSTRGGTPPRRSPRSLTPDGEIPLFNDSAFGQAPPTPWILDRAAELDGGRSARSGPARRAVGGLPPPRRRAASVVLFDAGEIGYDDQPGHAHADTLSYELSSGDAARRRRRRRLRLRSRQRSARTRVAREATTRWSSMGSISPRCGACSEWVVALGRWMCAARIGKASRRSKRLTTDTGTWPESPMHRRRMEHLGGDVWRVEDLAFGRGEHRAVSRLRLHPAFSVRGRQTDRLEAVSDRLVVRVVAESPARLDVEDGRYFPRFGVEERCLVIRLDAAGPLPLRICLPLRSLDEVLKRRRVFASQGVVR